MIKKKFHLLYKKNFSDIFYETKGHIFCASLNLCTDFSKQMATEVSFREDICKTAPINKPRADNCISALWHVGSLEWSPTFAHEMSTHNTKPVSIYNIFTITKGFLPRGGRAILHTRIRI